MRWKLASGNVIAKTNQPLQNKDFDRLVIYDYDVEGNKRNIYVCLYNPSTHLIRKSYNSNGVAIRLGPKCLGLSGGSWSAQDFASNHWEHLQELTHGANYITMIIGAGGSRISKVYGGAGSLNEDGYVNDRIVPAHQPWKYYYRATIMLRNGGHFNDSKKYVVSNIYGITW